MEMSIPCRVCTEISENGDLWPNQKRYWSDISQIVRAEATENSKKDLLFLCISGKIVKLIILIPYFTVGGAITMAKCECCGKGVTFGIKVSHSHRRSNRTWKPNVRRVKAVVEGSPKYIYACSRCLRAGKVTRAV